MIPELGWPPCRRHGRGFRRATCGPLLRVAGTASSLESVPRRSARKRRSAPSSGFALLGFPRSCTRLLWIVVFPSSSESGDQSEYGYDRPAAVPAASCLGLAVSASASGARSRRSSVRGVSAPASAYDTRSRSCSRCVLAVCLVVSGHLAHPAPRPVAAREYTHREALLKVLCSSSCSSRSYYKE